MRLNPRLVFVLLLLADPATFATEPNPSALGVTVASIHETRMTTSMNTPTFTDCRLYLNLTGDASADAHSVRRIRVSRAEDELGRDLVKPQEATADSRAEIRTPSVADEQRRLEAVAAEVATRRALRERASAAIGVPVVPFPSTYRVPQPVIALRNPSRQSATIKIVEGEIDLFTPTNANGGIVKLAKFAERPGEPITNEALAATGIRVAYFTRDAFETKGALLGAEAKETMLSAFKIYGADTVFVALRDPERLVVDFEVQSADGKRITTNPLTGGGKEWNRFVFVKTPPPADAQLVIRVAVPGAIKTYPFKLEKIPLP